MLDQSLPRTSETSAADPFDAGPFARLRAGRRALLAATVAWVPLIVLAAAQGYALRDDPRESLLLDVSAHGRYLVALPLLVLADAACVPRMALIARNFGAAGLVREPDRSRYEGLLASTRSLLASRRANLVILLTAYVASVALGRLVGQVPYAFTGSTWAAPIVDGARSLSLAGVWRGAVSQPLLLVVLGTWIWRMALWTRFLRGVARLDLRLVPSHPDLAGGLRFVSTSLPPFAVPALALGAWAAGSEANRVLLHAESSPRDLAYVLPVTLLVVLALFVAPLLALVRPLRHAKVRGAIEYGDLANALGRRFEERWLERGPALDADALGVQDFSATTDLYSIAANIRQMRVAPIDIRSLVPIVTTTLLPFIPVLLMALPLQQVLHFIARLLL
ncbi:MAG TPA: hypothetical protein VFY16_05835 [Gemmatimonadaceae bacterium]|nr:hypothetical protein [Gemmatimonadaceae bacterium]